MEPKLLNVRGFLFEEERSRHADRFEIFSEGGREPAGLVLDVPGVADVVLPHAFRPDHDRLFGARLAALDVPRLEHGHQAGIATKY